ncbi:MAG: Pyruvate kinase [Candidatus Magasanikbacteria bacterium GW2011_GWC2_40_17]|uniref:Pyruvate kinase n=1 Tax=Candidatus Magasanikbacteria bacterium GW2011_GWA2_42_32 TaxID=1619039 RepID=A0A0G1D4B3_9BACT|nr:MAG: Pyruvate kinase [Candidatus Magasanikbacteria bacterium GW2011_GWC2_40_17]KKS56868.1 MAG: Pyruvate kinase [Candidatus Magasanikbacteria bacterium GW2011_GWA2_42_32]OGH85652.1 MAG: pyruvate kinase [Candidatus Magasanikbacteria bacterium RIFOXYB2_FULL_38_10]
MTKRTKIVCTIGPASFKTAVIENLIKAGMNAARINFSHGTHESNGKMIDLIRKAADKLKVPVVIIADLQGPRIRVGILPKEGLTLKKGQLVKLSVSEKKLGANMIPVTYKNLVKDVSSGERILLDDGKIELVTKKIQSEVVEAEVRVGGVLTSNKGINLPDSVISINALTEKDKEDLKFIVRKDVDFVALSFVKNAQDILGLRFLIKDLVGGEAGKKNKIEIKIIAKIEKHEAIKEIDEIIYAADAIMVARGDLGLEMPAEEVPLLQKKMISKCLEAAKPVIVATQMLESMTHNPRPTRAEVSDVANAVIDHTDAVMLSAETANGEYPVEAVQTMSRVIIKTEASIFDDLPYSQSLMADQKTDVVMSGLSRLLAEKIKAKAILAASLTGETGRQISRFRPELLIFVATDNEKVRRQLNLSWGIVPFILPTCKTVEELIERSLVYLRKEKFIKKSDKLIIIAGEPVGAVGGVNWVEVKQVN